MIVNQISPSQNHKDANTLNNSTNHSENRILPIGKIMRADAQGFVQSDVSVKNIVHPWKQPIDDLVDQYQANLGDSLHSIYIRGSIVRGTAIEGVSDLDAIVLVSGSAKDIDWSWRKQVNADLREKYHYMMGVDVGINDVDKIINGQNTARSFMLKSMSVCVWGKDIKPELPKIKLGPKMLIARGYFPRIAHEDFFTEPDITLDERAKWSAKQIVRAGMELVMEEEQAYARDLYPCYEIFTRHHPVKDAAMKRALYQALFSAKNESDFSEMRDDIGPWLAEKLDQKYPLTI